MDTIAQVISICEDFWVHSWSFDGYQFSLIEVWTFEMFSTLVAIFVARILLFWVGDVIKGLRLADDSTEDIDDIADSDEEHFAGLDNDDIFDNDLSEHFDYFTGRDFDGGVDYMDIPDDWFD